MTTGTNNQADTNPLGSARLVGDDTAQAAILPIHLSIMRAGLRAVTGTQIVQAIDALNQPASASKRALVVYTHGDQAAGVPGERATVEIDMAGYPEFVADEIEANARALLSTAFSQLWNAKAHVVTAVNLTEPEAL